jgi:hypothetical protein
MKTKVSFDTTNKMETHIIKKSEAFPEGAGALEL